MIDFDILSRTSGEVMFTARIDCADTAKRSWKLRLAILFAIENKVDLRGADLSGAHLRDAYFSDADLSGAYFSDADLSGAYFSGADLRDAYFSGANFSGAYLRGADLRGADLSDAYFSGANFSGAHLRGADLRGAYFSGANFSGAHLRGADLRGADLSGAHLRGVPSIKNIHQSVYHAASNDGALAMDSWHECETTHCRAGWVVKLAGDAGAAMEFCMGTSAAAALIYIKSDPKLENIPDFFASNEDALEDMKRLAEKESKG